MFRLQTIDCVFLLAISNQSTYLIENEAQEALQFTLFLLRECWYAQNTKINIKFFVILDFWNLMFIGLFDRQKA